MNIPVENWVALRGSILAAIGDLVDRADGLNDPEKTLAEIARAIDVLTLAEHPLEQQAGRLQ
jgi:hypothetical protein